MIYKPTPGTWSVLYQRIGEREPTHACFGVGVNQIHYNELGDNTGTSTTVICNSILPDTDEEYLKQKGNIVADMTLIAAAPSMLFVLETLKDHFRRLPSYTPSELMMKQNIEAVIEHATKPENVK